MWAVDDLFAAAEQIVVAPPIVQSSEKIERTVVGQQAQLTAGQQQRGVRLETAASRLANRCMNGPQQVLEACGILRGQTVHDVEILRRHRSAMQHGCRTADDDVFHAGGVQRVE